MRITSTRLPGVLIVHPERFGDARGYFVETYHAERYAAAGMPAVFVQDNQSVSREIGTIRGLHFQANPAAQAKLVRVVRGRVIDVAVDLRRSSPRVQTRWVGSTFIAKAGIGCHFSTTS